ncbi:MAG: type II secretion system protein M [Moraxellaceae bacterium]|nr:type II secretion system protein M [Moraxellaceae bacterium]
MSAFFQSLQQEFSRSLAPWQARWRQLAPRDQLALQILGAVLGLLLLFFGLWQPSHKAALRAQAEYENNRQLQLWIQDSARHVQKRPVLAGGSVLGAANSLAGSSGLTLSRVEPQGESAVRIWIERADFNAMAGWLAQLAAQGVKIEEAQVERRQDGGVSGRFSLSQ